MTLETLEDIRGNAYQRWHKARLSSPGLVRWFQGRCTVLGLCALLLWDVIG